MYIARILYPVEVLGIGKRIGIWFCGCLHHCDGCSNPELWEFQDRYRTSLSTVKKLLAEVMKSGNIDGFTITGGEPFYQPEALLEIIRLISPISQDILVYSGYALEELRQIKNAFVDEVLGEIAILIDGRYIRERNTGVLLRGSDNQKVHILNEAFKSQYDEYFSRATNQIQNFTIGSSIISVGIHRDFTALEAQNDG